MTAGLYRVPYGIVCCTLYDDELCVLYLYIYCMRNAGPDLNALMLICHNLYTLQLVKINYHAHDERKCPLLAYLASWVWCMIYIL